MFKKVILLSLLQFVYSTVTKFVVSSCGDSTDLMQNVVLSVEPKLPQTDYTLYLNGDLSQTITKGTSKYDITYNFIPISPTTEDLCTEIDSSNISCPLLNGFISSESKGTIPIDLRGSLIIKNQWFNNDQTKILCMKFDIKL
jgi:hypothetical protein